jgi:Response regulator containing CheY-like receiver, AAA-type ATPase, and DNA-binding domains
MKQSNGTVRIYSEPNTGTTLKLYFKAALEGGKTRAAAALPRDMSHLAGKRVLLVEDNTDLLIALEDILVRVGIEVTAAPSGDDAMAIWEKDPNFDLIATDIVMPGKLQGTHLAKAIRAMDPRRRLHLHVGLCQ